MEKTATKNLEDDHIHILRLTDIMEKITESDNPDISHLEKIVDIIRNFADGIHHAKEEEHFFPFLSGRGFSTSAGPVAVMLHEHVAGRNYVQGMVQNIELFKNGDSDALGKIYMNMNGYAGLLKSHIGKENNILFRMADRALSNIDNEELLSKFEEAEKMHSDKNQYIKDINILSDFYEI
jgi:hemerythrin-like domain-containing protein